MKRNTSSVAPCARVVLLLSVPMAMASAHAKQTMTIVLPSPCPGPVSFAAGELERALSSRGWLAVRSSGASRSPAVLLVVWPNGNLDPRRFTPPQKAESYRIAREGKERLFVIGSDATGTMYGALEVAEQVRWSRAGDTPLSSVKERARSPYLELRGVNQFLHKQAMDDPDSWFYSMTFWQAYVDMLARTRHNFLDLHALYDMMTTGFPNVFPYLIHLDEYPEADVGKEQAQRNLEVLRKVIAIATDRGVKVGLMNYNAPANVPAGKLADYTAKCVERLLRELPGLWAFGFRIGESGQPEDFFKHAYIAGINNCGRSVNLYTRSWIASRAKIMEIAAAHKGRFLVEIKYNGEQLGLPYQVQGERMAGWGSYSFQAYTSKPRNYSILWQIRACGTHRIFQWGDPEFARRTARSCRLGDGTGFSLEPISAYYPMNQYYLNPKTFPKPFFNWDFQRNWFWYEVWGRTGYDPEVPDSLFENLFKDQSGPKAGRALFQTMVAASKLVPLIYSYHCLGPDHRNMAPEFETGNGHSGRRNADGSAERIHNGIKGFLEVEPLDDTVMDSPRTYVAHVLKGEPCLPFGPNEASAELERCADAALKAVSHVRDLEEGTPEARLDQILDVEALAALARYYADKIQAVTYLEFFNRTGNLNSLSTAREFLRQAIGHWQDLAEVTETHFLPVIERLRMYTAAFTWREEGKDLPRELEELEDLARKAANAPAAATAPEPEHPRPDQTKPPIITVAPPQLAAGRTALKVVAEVRASSGTSSVLLFYRPMPSFYSWQSIPMKAIGSRKYLASVPVTPEGLLYRIVAAGVTGMAAEWPSFLEETPYRCIDPWEPKWVSHGCVALLEGAPTYQPRAGERVFPDREETIQGIPEELTSLVGVRYPESLLTRAQGQSYGGYPIQFKALKATRVFVAFRGDPMPGYGRYVQKGLALGGKQYDIFARDYEPGEYTLVFARGPLGILLGFKERGPGEKELEVPSVMVGGKLVWEATKRDFVTTTADCEFYEPKLGARVYIDRNYAVKRLPKELEQCIGLRFSNDRAKQGGLSVPFKLDRPATLFVVFGNPEEGPWEKPQKGWRLHAKDAYQHGPGDEVARSIYCKDCPAGDGVLTLERGTAVVLGFK